MELYILNWICILNRFNFERETYTCWKLCKNGYTVQLYPHSSVLRAVSFDANGIRSRWIFDASTPEKLINAMHQLKLFEMS